ncbi:kinase-like domain-containing protein [Chaetomium sp. MPI-CAGE-AT-0009]|nr:kinase-like domain-containing protein [Chaetomium sp. MPI-CAGE-AT-0009]
MENFITLPDPPTYAYYSDLDMGEDVNCYRPGEFHPVLIGDMLDGRFKVVNKLGFGSEVTVWLCRDVTLGKWRAIKIYAAQFSHEDLASVKLTQPTPERPSIFATSLEHFWIVGPNGRHLCAVQPLLGPPVSSVAFHYRHEPMFLRDLCRQLAKAVHLLHEKGFCHGRIHPNNLLFLLNDTIHELTEEQINHLVGGPHLCRVRQCVAKQHRDTGATVWVLTDYTPPGQPEDRGCQASCFCTSHDPTCQTFNNASLPANLPKYIVSPAPLDIFDGSCDADGRDLYMLCTIALADLDACIKLNHTPPNPNTPNTPNTTTPLRTTTRSMSPTGFTAPETWATTNPTTTTNPPLPRL